MRHYYVLLLTLTLYLSIQAMRIIAFYLFSDDNICLVLALKVPDTVVSNPFRVTCGALAHKPIA